MMSNRRLSRSLADASFFEFKRQLEYKVLWCGGTIVTADRWFASSKICSTCAVKHDALILSERSWTCNGCKTLHDRDLNAAINLRNYAVSSTVKACGEEGSGLGRKIKTKPASVKQEFNVKATYA